MKIALNIATSFSDQATLIMFVPICTVYILSENNGVGIH